MFFLVLFFLSPFAYTAEGERFVLSTQGDYISGAENATAFRLNGEFLSGRTYTVGMHLQQESRILFGNKVVEDSRVGIQGSYNLPGGWSTKWKSSIAQQETLYALLNIKGNFLWQFKGFDLDLGVEHFSYEELGQIQTVSIQADYSFRSGINVGGALAVSNTTPTANEITLFGQLRRKGLEYRFDYKVGKKVEADGLLGDANSYDFKVAYSAKIGKKYIKLGPGLVYYDGTVRDETRLYLMLLSVF